MLGKIAAMQTDTTSEPTGSLVPKGKPEPIRSRNPASRMGARLLSALRGDKYMVGAYPPDWPGAASPSKEPPTTPAASGMKGAE